MLIMYAHFENKHFAIQSPDSLDNAIKRFEQQNYYIFPIFFKEKTLTFLKRLADSDEYKKLSYGTHQDTYNIGHEMVLNKRNQTQASMLMKNNELYSFISAFCQSSISSFDGRIYKLEPSAGFLDWHQDSRIESRRIAISINLSDDIYNNYGTGGTFEMRDYKSKTQLLEFRNNVFGQAIIFNVSPNQLEHRVTQVSGESPRIALSGWFRE